MKNCKRIAILAIILMLSTLLNVYAADYGTPSIAEVIITQSATTAKIGETVTATIVAKYAEGIEGFEGVLSWDSTKLEFTNSAEITESTGGLSDFFNEETGKFLLTKMASSTTKDELKVATLKFKVLDSVEVDEKLTVLLSDIEAGGYNGKIEDKTIEVTVAKETTPDDGEQKPGDEDPKPGDEDPKPGDEDPNPGDKDPNPGDGDPNPGDKNPEEPKDNTIADKPMNNAGLDTYVLMGIILITVMAIILNVKCKKYRNLK